MSWEMRQGDALDRLREMPDESVQCCVTSPPYWGLRDYGVDGQIGLEETPEQFVATMVEVFTEVRRVLRSDGTLWLNIGDSYAGSWGAQSREHAGKHAPNVSAISANQVKAARGRQRLTGAIPPGTDLKPKDLVGIPWMLAFALRADGWYLRRDIIWAKPNPMPESVTDRPTSAHEYLFLLTKSQRYFYDAEAIREPAIFAGPNGAQKSPYAQGFGRRSPDEERKRQDKQRGHGRRHDGNDHWDAMSKDEQQALGRNKRSVWTIATKPFPDAHFATFPPDLVEPCIKAGTPSRVCGECGAPWRRITERRPTGETQKMADGWATGDGGHGTIHRDGRERGERGVPVTATVTLGFEPTCDHTTAEGLAVVLDPFCGAATTGLVATQLGRDFVGIELNPEYVALGEDRIRRWENDPAGRLRRATPIEAQASIFETAEMPEAAA